MSTLQLLCSRAYLRLFVRRGDEGVSLVEYALLVALISVICIGALRYFQGSVSSSLDSSSSAIGNAGG